MELTIVLSYLLIGTVAGLHSSCWGAYRDPPYEKFSKFKFFRSIFVGGFLGVLIFYFLQIYKITEPNLGIVFTFIMGFERIFTEFLKVFAREENEKKYKIPMRFHYFGKIIKSRIRRMIIGIIFLSSPIPIFYILTSLVLPPSLLSTSFIGLLAGVGIAFCGAWRASPFEGFMIRKFIKSPLAGIASGIILGIFSKSFPLIFFGSIGMIHMILQLLKIISVTLVNESPPSKFGSKKPLYPEYIKKRNIILIPYFLTWLLFFLILL